MQIRKAVAEDMPRLGHVMSVSFRTAFRGLVTDATLEACAQEERCAGLLAHVFEQGKTNFLTDGQAGMLAWQQMQDGAEIIAIHSLPESWGSGLGSALLKEALAQIGSQPVSLWVFTENARARHFYEKHGLHWDGQRRDSDFDGAEELHYVRFPDERK